MGTSKSIQVPATFFYILKYLKKKIQYYLKRKEKGKEKKDQPCPEEDMWKAEYIIQTIFVWWKLVSEDEDRDSGCPGFFFLSLFYPSDCSLEYWQIIRFLYQKSNIGNNCLYFKNYHHLQTKEMLTCLCYLFFFQLQNMKETEIEAFFLLFIKQVYVIIYKQTKLSVAFNSLFR